MSGIQSVSVSAAQNYASASPQSGQSLQPFSNLDLTEAQRTQLRSIFTSAKQNGTSQADVQQQVNAVLSPAQQQTLAADLKAGGSHHGHHRHDLDASTASTASATSTAAPDATDSTDSTVLDAVTNIQNQAAAAQSTLIGNLQKQVLASSALAAAQNVTTAQSSAQQSSPQ